VLPTGIPIRPVDLGLNIAGTLRQANSLQPDHPVMFTDSTGQNVAVTFPPAQDPYRDQTRPLDPYEEPPQQAHLPVPYPSQPYPGPYPPTSGVPYPPVSPAYPAYPQHVTISHASPAPTSGLAVASMVLSIIGLVSGCCTFGIPALLAVILGHVAVAETRGGAKSGHGMAIAGLVMGYIIVAPALVFSIWFIFAGGMAVLASGS
jgi:hypothetical protein